MKIKEELNALKEEVETMNNKLHELTEEELEEVTGGKAGSEGDYISSLGGWFCSECKEVTSNAEASANGYQCKDCGHKFNTGMFLGL